MKYSAFLLFFSDGCVCVVCPCSCLAKAEDMRRHLSNISSYHNSWWRKGKENKKERKEESPPKVSDTPTAKEEEDEGAPVLGSGFSLGDSFCSAMSQSHNSSTFLFLIIICLPLFSSPSFTDEQFFLNKKKRYNLLQPCLTVSPR